MSLLTDDRVTHLASLRVYYNALGADDVVTLQAFRWYSVLSEDWARASTSRDSNGVGLLEYLPGCGIVNRAFLVLQDASLTDYSTSGGSWEEERPGTGVPRKKRLHQYNTTANQVFSATSAWSHLANPSLAFSFILPETPPDHDGTTYPPLARAEFAGGLWAVQFSNDGAYLLRKTAGVWEAVQEIPQPTRSGYNNAEEFFCWVRCHRGQLFVSTDLGKTYTAYPSGAVPAGKVTFRGQGGEMSFGVHQLRYYAGVYTSQPKATLYGDYSAATPSFTRSRYTAPSGGSVSIADASTTGQARFTVTLTPASTVAGGPFTFYSAAEAYAVRMTYDPDTSSPIGGYLTTFDNAVLRAIVNKERDIDVSRADLDVRLDPEGTFLLNLGRYAKCALYQGYVDCDGVEQWMIAPLFVGYMEHISPSTRAYHDANVSISLCNRTTALKRKLWHPLNRVPLGGQSVNDALDEILGLAGFGTGDRSWHAAGAVTLPSGSPENPQEWPPDGESWWATMQRIAARAGLEIGVTDAGIFYTLPQDSYTGTIHAFDAVPVTFLRDLVQGINATVDATESATQVIVAGELEDGSQALALAQDYAAETNPLNARFCGLGADMVFESVGGTGSLGLVQLQAQMLARDLFRVPKMAEIEIPVQPDTPRRDQAVISGCEQVGVYPTEAWVILTLRHDIGPFVTNSGTTAGLARIG